VANVWLEAVSLWTKDMWMNYIKHCEQIIRDDWVKCMGTCSVDNCPPFIINLGSDSDSEYAFEDLDSDSELNDKTDFCTKLRSKLGDKSLDALVALRSYFTSK
jgi:hypothetical protein